MRLQHGLNADSRWIDPDQPDFDVEKVIKDFQQWQYQPFVKLLLDVKRHVLVHPFVPERLAALKAWVQSGSDQAIRDRRPSSGSDRLIEVVKIQAFELAAEGQSVDPYVIVFDQDQQVLRTVTASGVREALWRDFKSTDKGVNQPREFRNGQPLFCEIWDDNTFFDTFLGGFVIYPEDQVATIDKSGDLVAELRARILWDWKEPQSISRPGFAWVTIRFLKRESPTPNLGSRKAGP